MGAWPRSSAQDAMGGAGARGGAPLVGQSLEPLTKRAGAGPESPTHPPSQSVGAESGTWNPLWWVKGVVRGGSPGCLGEGGVYRACGAGRGPGPADPAPARPSYPRRASATYFEGRGGRAEH